MSDDNNAELVAPCGLYCSGCPIFRASSDSALAERISQTLGLPLEQVKCLGCRAEKGHISIMGGPLPHPLGEGAYPVLSSFRTPQTTVLYTRDKADVIRKAVEKYSCLIDTCVAASGTIAQ